MNLSEVVRSQTLINRLMVAMPMKTRSNEETTPQLVDCWQNLNWQSCTAGLAILAFGYRFMRAIKNKLRPRKCNALVNATRNRRLNRRNEASVSGGTSSNLESNVTEVCPICLEPPRIGVRTGCDHRMCATCLRRYCEIHAADHKRNRPPPCPLCRTPLVAVTLMYSQINNDAVDTKTAAWIDKFNAARGRPANKTGFLANNALIKLVVLATLLAGGVAGFQEVTGIDLAAYNSFFVATFGVTLMSCLWLRCHGQEMEEEEEEAILVDEEY